MRLRFLAFSAIAFAIGIAPAAAQDFPNRAITYIVPSSPGGGQDTIGRIVASRASEITGQSVVVENQPGAAGNVGANAGAHAAPDGYTVVQLTPAAAVNMSLYDDPGYDLLKDLQPITQLAFGPFLLCINADVPAQNLEEFLALAKEKPGELNFGSSGVGGTSHMATELFKVKAGVDLFHVPYQGSGPALIDLLAGRIQVMLLQPAVAQAGIEEGRLRALGISTLERYSQLPDMPTLNEQGVKGFETGSWYSLFAPAGTPPEVVAKLNEIFTQAAEDRADEIVGQGFEVITTSPEELQKKTENEVAQWGEVVNVSGVKPEE